MLTGSGSILSDHDHIPVHLLTGDRPESALLRGSTALAGFDIEVSAG